MIDIIILVFTVAVFYAGVWVGKTYGSLGKAWGEAKRWLSGLLGS